MSVAARPSSSSQNTPTGFVLIGVFLLFGASMASYAAATLAFPGTPLDLAWTLNPEAHRELATLGRVMALPFLGLAIVLFLAGMGWFRRRRWGWALAVAVIFINLLGDVFNALRGERAKGTAGVVIAGLLLIYITRRQVRDYFLSAA